MPITVLQVQGDNLTMAVMSLKLCRYSTIRLLCAGSTRAKHRAVLQAWRCRCGGSSSNSRPVRPPLTPEPSCSSSCSVMMPTLLQIDRAVPLLSPGDTNPEWWIITKWIIVNYHVLTEYSNSERWHDESWMMIKLYHIQNQMQLIWPKVAYITTELCMNIQHVVDMNKKYVHYGQY